MQREELGNDVRYEDILEITKKTISSKMSSYRTGRDANNKFNKGFVRKESDQLNILKILNGVSNIQ